MRFLVLSTLTALSAAVAADRPNLVFLFADDLGRYASAYADPAAPSPNDVVKTPVMDRIAEEGALFLNAFVSAPSCTPSRGAVYTGRHFFRNGSASQLHNPWQRGVADPFEDVQGMPVALAEAGYHIGWSHKWHLRESLMGGRENEFSNHGAEICNFSEKVSGADDPAAKRRDILEAVRLNFRDFLANRGAGQPFFYSFNPTNTHRAWVRGSGQALWGLDPDDLRGKLPPFLPDTEVVREDFADYLGEVMAFDAACGIILEELEAQGALDDTLVCVSGDHGAPGFPSGKCNVVDFGSTVPLILRWPGKISPGGRFAAPVSLIDVAPTFLGAAGVESKDEPDGQNLLPAIAPGGDESKLRGWALIGRERHVKDARNGFLPYPVRALRTPDFLYVINFKPERWPMGDPLHLESGAPLDFAKLAAETTLTVMDLDASPTKAELVLRRDEEDMVRFAEIAWGRRPAEELYELKTDPHQMRNLADDAAFAAKKAELRARLMAELERRDDPRLRDAFDRPPYLPELAKKKAGE